MKIDFNLKKERSKVEKCLRHLDAIIDLFSNEIKSIEIINDSSLYWVVVELITRSGKPINQKYSFSSEGERDILLKRIIEQYELEENNI